MKKQLFMIALAAVGLLTMQTSCKRLARNLSENAEEELFGENGKQPRYLHDSDEWGPVVRQTLNLEDFDQVKSAGLVDIVFTQGDDFSVVAEGNEKVIPLYEFAVADGILTVTTKKEKIRNIPFMRLLVTAPTLTGINMTGVGDIFFRQPVEFFNDLDICVSGTGDIEIDSMMCDAFNAEISGAGDIEVRRLQCLSADVKISGTSDAQIKRISCLDNASFSISGDGEIDAKVKCTNLNVEVFGKGEASIRCECDEVKARAEGNGRIDLEGTAKNVVTHKESLATISTRQLRISK